MQRLRTFLTFLVVTAVVVPAFAGSAAATTLTSPEGTTYTNVIVASSTSSALHGSFAEVDCDKSEIKGTIEKHGAWSASGKISSLTFTECNYATTVNKAGSLSIDSSNGVTSSGAEISIVTSVGTCVFTTSSSYLGALSEGPFATLAITGAKIPRTGGNFLCGSAGSLTGYYHVFTPSTLYVD